MNMQKSVLITISTAGPNVQKALVTIALLAEWVGGTKHRVVLCVETPCDRRSPMPGMPHVDASSLFAAFSKTFGNEVVIWDKSTSLGVLAAVPENTPPPFSTSFCYGGTVNKSLLAGSATGCDLAIRVDPGVARPDVAFDDFVGVASEHLTDSYGLISGLYRGRRALRLQVVPEQHHDAFVGLMGHFAEIDVNLQITSGALSTRKLPGLPAIVVEPYELGGSRALGLVYGVDDHLPGLLARFVAGSVTSHALPHITVPRFDEQPGSFPKGHMEYFTALAGTVFLAALIRAPQRRHSDAILVVQSWLDELAALVGTRLVREDVFPAAFVDAIYAGWSNHSALQGSWTKMVDILGPVVRNQLLAFERGVPLNN